MRYFFDVHLNGETLLDERGTEFASLAEASHHVLTCARISMAEGTFAERKILAQTIVEITDHDGLSEVIVLAEAIRPQRNGRKPQGDAARA